MRKILLTTLLLLSLGFIACSNNYNEEKENTDKKTDKKIKTEYTMEELNDELVKFNELYNKAIKNLTTDEIKENSKQIYKDIVSQTDIPVDRKIQIRGKISNINCLTSFIMANLCDVEHNDGHNINKNPFLYCEFKNNPELVWIDENQNVLISGKIDSSSLIMTDCELLSPKVEADAFDNNLDAVVEDIMYTYNTTFNSFEYYEETKIFTTIDSVTEIKSTEAKDYILNNYPCKNYNEYTSFDFCVNNNDYVYVVKGDDTGYAMMLFCDYQLEVDDKIMITCFPNAEIYDDEYNWIVYTDLLLGNIYIYK